MSHDTVLESLNADANITAHRANSQSTGKYSQCLEYTWECGADSAEIDVREQRRILILLHDDSLERITGVVKKVTGDDLPGDQPVGCRKFFRKDFGKNPTLEKY